MYLSSATNRITVTWGNYGKVSGVGAAHLLAPSALPPLSHLCSPCLAPPALTPFPSLSSELLGGLIFGAATDLLRAAAEVENHRGQASGAVQGTG